MKLHTYPVRLAGVALVSSLLASSLSACFPLAVGGMAAGTMVATDRRTMGAQTDDKAIEMKAASRINQLFGDKVHVNINSYNRKALLTGEVYSPEAKSEIEKLVASVDNVVAVANELEVTDVSSYKTRSSDVLITAKVKAALIESKDIFASAYKITTERGIVYLQGRVTKREGDRAAQEASNVGSVLKVIKVFDYLTEEELANVVNVKVPEEPVKEGGRTK